MSDRPAKLRELARRDDADVAPSAPAETLDAYPDETDVIGEALRAFGTERRSVAVTAVADRLTAGDPAVRRGAASALAVCFESCPDVEPGVVAELGRALADDGHVVRKEAGRALRNIARRNPAAVRNAVDQLPDLFEPDSPDLLAVGLDAATAIVEADPGAGVPLLDPLLETLEALADRELDQTEDRGGETTLPPAVREHQRQCAIERDRQRKQIVSLVGTTIATRPAAAASVRPALRGALRHEGVSVDRAVLAEALGRAAESDPDAVAPVIGDLAALLGCRDVRVAGNAAWTLGVLADAHGRRVADATEAHVDALVDLLDADSPDARVASATLLAYVSEHRTDAVDRAADSLAAALNDENPDVRASAALALGFGGYRRSLSDLRALAENDLDDRVRVTASTAIERIEKDA